jgi:hypothetical protein
MPHRFKEKVRARMKKTGEKYTAARAHLEARSCRCMCMWNRARCALRACEECGQIYCQYGELDRAGTYEDFPYSYDRGYANFCLTCWLGVGPASMPEIWVKDPRSGSYVLRVAPLSAP